MYIHVVYYMTLYILNRSYIHVHMHEYCKCHRDFSVINIKLGTRVVRGPLHAYNYVQL